MSEATKTVLWLIPMLAISILLGYKVGEERMKHWQDQWYHGEMEREYQSEHPCFHSGGSNPFVDVPKYRPAKPAKCNPPHCSPTSKEPFHDVDGKPVADVPAKEVIQEHAFGKPIPCNPPLSENEKAAGVGCTEWQSIHIGWTCEDKQRVLQRSEDGKLHCILLASQP